MFMCAASVPEACLLCWVSRILPALKWCLVIFCCLSVSNVCTSLAPKYVNSKVNYKKLYNENCEKSTEIEKTTVKNFSKNAT